MSGPISCLLLSAQDGDTRTKRKTVCPPPPQQLQSLLPLLRQFWGVSCALCLNPVSATAREGGNFALSHGFLWWEGVCSCPPSPPPFHGQGNGGGSVSPPSSPIPSGFQAGDLHLALTLPSSRSPFSGQAAAKQPRRQFILLSLAHLSALSYHSLGGSERLSDLLKFTQPEKAVGACIGLILCPVFFPLYQWTP